MRSTRTRFDAIQAQAAVIAEYYARAARQHQHQPAEVVLPEGKVEYCDCGETRHRDARGALVGFTAGARLVLALLVLAAAACGPSSEIIPDPNPSTGSGRSEQDCGDPPYPGEDRCIVRAPHRGLLDALADLLVPSAHGRGLDRSADGGGPDVGADPPPVSAFEHLRRLAAEDAPADAAWTDPLLSLRVPSRERIPGMVAAVCILALAVALLRRSRSRNGAALVLLVLGCAATSGCSGSAGACALFVGVGALALMAGAAALMLPHRSPPARRKPLDEEFTEPNLVVPDDERLLQLAAVRWSGATLREICERLWPLRWVSLDGEPSATTTKMTWPCPPFQATPADWVTDRMTALTISGDARAEPRDRNEQDIQAGLRWSACRSSVSAGAPAMPRRAVLALALVLPISARAAEGGKSTCGECKCPPPPPPKDPPKSAPPAPKKRPVKKLDWVFLLLVSLAAGAAQADERIGSMGERRPSPPTTRTEPHEPAAPKESTSPITVGERPPAPKVGMAGMPPAATAADLIDSGEQALRDHSPALAHGLCIEAVRQARAEMVAASAAFVPPPPEKPVDLAAAARSQERIDHYYAAYYCRGRAALALNLLSEAEESARWVIGPRGWVLLGDVLRAQDRCREARAEYLRTVEDAESRVRLGVLPAVRPEEMGIMQAAAAGLVECGGDWPKVVPTPNEPQPSPWPEKRTGAEGRSVSPS